MVRILTNWAQILPKSGPNLVRICGKIQEYAYLQVYYAFLYHSFFSFENQLQTFSGVIKLEQQHLDNQNLNALVSPA